MCIRKIVLYMVFDESKNGIKALPHESKVLPKPRADPGFLDKIIYPLMVRQMASKSDVNSSQSTKK